MCIFELSDDSLDAGTAPFVAAVAFSRKPRTVRRTLQLVGKDMERAGLLGDLAHTALALLKVIEVGCTMLIDIYFVSSVKLTSIPFIAPPAGSTPQPCGKY